MNQKDIALWVVEMTIKYGVPAVQAIIATWTDDTAITAEMVNDMEKDMASKTPMSYFNEND